MSRFFVPKENVKGNLIYINGKEAKHILTVMRLGQNDNVTVFDGTGKEYAGFIKEAKLKSLIVEIVKTKIPKLEKDINITLVQAIPKKRKMDYLIEKATELGVDKIVPIISQRVIFDIKRDEGDGKTKRWQKIANEASKQCGRADVPDVAQIKNFKEAINEIDDYGLSLLACLSEDTMALKEAISGFEKGKAIVFIGPEGDFTKEEIDLAKEKNCRLISLGKRVLKSDTAALYVLSVLNHEFPG